MCLVWSCVALGLVPYDPSTVGVNGMIYDPLTRLGDIVLSKSGNIGMGKIFLASVNILAGSAICTTVIGSILASTQYFDDLITNMDGSSHRILDDGDSNRTSTDYSTSNEPSASPKSNTKKYTLSPKYKKLITHTLAVAPSATVALWGSSNLYYYATSFAGEFPCTLLYGLIPPLCNLKLRWMYRKDQNGGIGYICWKDVAMQIVLAAVSLLILIASGASKQ